MTQDEIIRMMKEAGFYIAETDEFHPEWERFAALVAAHEREKQAEQKPIAKEKAESYREGYMDGRRDSTLAAPVRTKDLTVSELDAIIEKHYDDEMDLKALILDGIAADREKNK